MDTRELLEKISVLPVIAGSLAEDILAGSFGSIFKGQGMEFDEVRHYQPGDDIRSIDWNASARFGNPFVKMYREERDLTLMILLDISASMFRSPWLSGEDFSDRAIVSPYEQGLIAAALLAFAAERTGQRVGAFLFDRETERIFPPRRGRRHIMTFISGALQYQENGRATAARDGRRVPAAGSNLRAALNGAGSLLKRRSLIAVISDFFCAGWEQEMASLCRGHDVFALRIFTPEDMDLPDWGLAEMRDPETGARISAPAGFSSFREAWANWHRERGEAWAGVCGRSGAARLELSTDADAAAALFRFFGAGSGRSPSSRSGSGYRGGRSAGDF